MISVGSWQLWIWEDILNARPFFRWTQIHQITIAGLKFIRSQLERNICLFIISVSLSLLEICLPSITLQWSESDIWLLGTKIRSSVFGFALGMCHIHFIFFSATFIERIVTNSFCRIHFEFVYLQSHSSDLNKINDCLEQNQKFCFLPWVCVTFMFIFILCHFIELHWT